MSEIGEIEVGADVLCSWCGTKQFRNIEANNGKDNEDYGVIAVHKKGCSYVRRLLKNSVEV